MVILFLSYFRISLRRPHCRMNTASGATRRKDRGSGAVLTTRELIAKSVVSQGQAVRRNVADIMPGVLVMPRNGAEPSLSELLKPVAVWLPSRFPEPSKTFNCALKEPK